MMVHARRPSIAKTKVLQEKCLPLKLLGEVWDVANSSHFASATQHISAGLLPLPAHLVHLDVRAACCFAFRARGDHAASARGVGGLSCAGFTSRICQRARGAGCRGGVWCARAPAAQRRPPRKALPQRKVRLDASWRLVRAVPCSGGAAILGGAAPSQREAL